MCGWEGGGGFNEELCKRGGGVEKGEGEGEGVRRGGSLMKACRRI